MLKHYIQRGFRKLKVKIFGKQKMELEKRREQSRKRRKKLLMKKRQNNMNNNNNSNSKGNKQNGNHGNGDIHHHHHHHHHIHHHHLHLCSNGGNKTVATTPPPGGRRANGDLNHHKKSPNKKAIPSIKQEPENNQPLETNAVVPSQTNNLAATKPPPSVEGTGGVMPPPSIVIDDVDSCDQQQPNQPLSNLPQMKNTTALIIPDTTVVICASGSLPGSVKSQGPVATVSLFPSLSLTGLHRGSVNEAEICSHTDMGCTCRYRSVGDPECGVPELSKDKLDSYEKGVYEDVCDSDFSSDDEVFDSDDDYEYDLERSWMKKKRLLVVKFCESDCFKVSIMTAIFLNTVTMAMEHYQQVG